MKRILVIGIGSLIMKDDGIGARVVNAIQSGLLEHDIGAVVGETDFQFCIDEILPDDFLIVIDAMAPDTMPGSLELMPLSEALMFRAKLRAQHEFSLFDAISLQEPEPEGCLIGIEAAEIGFGLELSEPLNQRFEQICSEVFRAVIKIKEELEHA